MNDLQRQLRELGISNDTIYEVSSTNSFRDYVDERDYGYYDSERFYDESGRSVWKGSTYIPTRFDDWAA